MPQTTLQLQDWFAPLDFSEVRRSVLAKKALLLPAREVLARQVMDATGVASVDDLIGRRPQTIYAWFNKLDGDHTTAPISAEVARRFYDGGFALCVQDVPDLDVHRQAIASELGLAPSAVRFSIFCNRAAAVTPAHFDPVDLVILQLRGRKTWRVAPNTFAPYPLHNWAPGRPVGPQLRQYAHGEPPTEMPVDAEEHVLEPGAVLHVPRGYWHSTASDRESLSLHVQLTPPTGMDLVLAALRNELIRDPWWHQPAHGLDVSATLDRMQEACARVVHAASRLDARDIVLPADLGRTRGGDGTFVRRGQASCSVESIDTSGSRARVVVVKQAVPIAEVTHIEVPRELVEPCLRLNALPTGTVFELAKFGDMAHVVENDAVMDLVNELEKSGLLRRV